MSTRAAPSEKRRPGWRRDRDKARRFKGSVPRPHQVGKPLVARIHLPHFPPLVSVRFALTERSWTPLYRRIRWSPRRSAICSIGSVPQQQRSEHNE